MASKLFFQSKENLIKDKELAGFYEKNYLKMIALKDMVSNDSKYFSSISENTIPNSFPENKKTKYNKLLNIYKGLMVGIQQDSGIRFIFFYSGSAPGKSEAKGVLYLPSQNKIEKINNLGNLDNTSNLQEGFYTKKINRNWYIFYQKDN